MDKPELIAAFLTTGTFCQMVGAGFASSLTRKLGKVPAYVLVQAIIVIGSIALYFVSNSNVWVIFVLFGLINFFVQMGAPILFTMAADTVEYGELKTGRRVTGLVFSGALFALKLGVAIGGWLIGLVLFPAIGHFLLIPIVCLYKLNQSRCDEIRQELDSQSPA
jgi:GPH family glycoside/pentoside/hexuronide:cation symporter